MARVRRLHPDSAELDAGAFLAEVDLPDERPQDRPHVAVNMVASVDARTAVGGRSAPLTSPFDRALFHALRRAADAVLVGPRTLSAERYGPLVKAPEQREERIARGLSPMPLACVVTRSGQIDLSVPLFDEPAQTVVVFSGASLPDVDRPADVRVEMRDPADLDPSSVMRLLRAEFGVTSLLCEGGATMNAALFRAGVVDELFLSVSPELAGGSDPLALVAGELGAPVTFALRWMLETDGTVFLRYAVRRDQTV